MPGLPRSLVLADAPGGVYAALERVGRGGGALPGARVRVGARLAGLDGVDEELDDAPRGTADREPLENPGRCASSGGAGAGLGAGTSLSADGGARPDPGAFRGGGVSPRGSSRGDARAFRGADGSAYAGSFGGAFGNASGGARGGAAQERQVGSGGRDRQGDDRRAAADG